MPIYVNTVTQQYSYDPTKIEIVGNTARLLIIDISSHVTNENFTNASSFSYVSSVTQIAGNELKQVDQRPVDSTFFAPYSTNINGSWGNGVLTGTPVGGASVLGGGLDLAHDDVRYVDYGADLNADSQQTGCIRFIVIPNYSGNPSSDRSFFYIAKGNLDLENCIQITQTTTGLIKLEIANNVGSVQIAKHYTSENFTSGVPIEIELNWDITAGATRLFIGGILKDSETLTNTFVRDSAINLLRIGSNYGASRTSNFKIDSFLIFSTVQHGSNYTPSTAPSETIYIGDIITFPVIYNSQYGNINKYLSFSSSEQTQPKYTINDLFWDGSSWSSSINSYNQANTKVEVNSHILTCPTSEYINIKLCTTQTNTQTKVSSFALSYQNNIYDMSNPTLRLSSTLAVQGVSSFTIQDSYIVNDLVKVTIEIDGIQKYWAGSDFTTSNCYAQTNVESVLDSAVTNSLDLSLGANIGFVTYLHSDEGKTTPTIDGWLFYYDFYNTDATTPDLCTVYGNVFGIDGTAQNSVQVVVNLLENVIYDNISVIPAKTTTTSTNENGYWELEVVTTERMIPTYVKYKFTMQNSFVNFSKLVTIPNTTTHRFAELE